MCQTRPLSFESETASCKLRLSKKSLNISDENIKTSSAISVYNKLPFVNSEKPERQFKTILDIQATALCRRLLQTRQKKVVLGISGGSDSSQALLVCAQAFKRLAYDPQGILAVIMPGPGSSAESVERASALIKAAEATAVTIPIFQAVEAHLRDIGHPGDLFDTSYENAQARERTQILMDLANQEGALMVGTGDMSELALGWCTFNGDHMSFYNPNIGLPKTLLLQVLPWAGKFLFGSSGEQAAKAVADAAITPELLPLQKGEPLQATEKILGPYQVHDFYLYYGIYLRQTPRVLFAEARKVFAGQYTSEQLLQWLRNFFSRFFMHQFKRSASTDGPQLVEFSLSPRGGWVMPSDASAALWLQEIDSLRKELEY